MVLPGLAVILAAATVLAAPPPNAPIPHDAADLAHALVSTKQELSRDVDGWRATGARSAAPDELTLNALYEQRIDLRRAQKPRPANATTARPSTGLARELRTNLAAKRELWRLTPVSHRRRYRTGRALSPAALLGDYRVAERRFGVPWPLLAAVNFVESAFNKLRNNSATGAQGPMQFMPATWRAYGLGGDIHDPHDAILAAANYLHANGAPRNEARALFRYNPSPLYVDAVLRYARRIAADPRAFYDYYTWQVYVGTQHGLRRITGPGLR